MKATHILLSAFLAASFTGATGCGVRDTIVIPDPPDPNAPKEIGTITVTVIDQDSKPVSGATVSLKDAKGGAVGGQKDVTSGEDGVATFKKVPTGQGYTVAAESGGVVGSQSGLGIDGETPLTVKVMLIAANGARGTIGGSAVDGLTGQPLEGATVSVMGTQNTVKAQADGSFVLKNVPVGNPTVVAIMPGFRESRVNVSLRAGKLERAELKLYPTGDSARYGHTIVTTEKAILEFDTHGNRFATNPRGANQARTLPDGNVLVAGAASVAVVNPTNAVLWSYQPLLLGRLNSPQGVFRAASGNFFIADTNNNRVIEVSQGHKVERTIRASFVHPMSVESVDANHTALVADAGNNRVVEVDTNGTVLWSVGDGTTGLLNHPSYASRLPNGNTLITDSGNHRVLEVNKQQRLVWSWGGDGKRETCYFPSSALRLPNGNTLIADTGNNRVIEVKGAGVVFTLPQIERPLFAERI